MLPLLKSSPRAPCYTLSPIYGQLSAIATTAAASDMRHTSQLARIHSTKQLTFPVKSSKPV
ncbi:MAG: hypothetical protein AAFY11_13640, partial [Cyanobacteria bacterium J06641_5]